MWMGLVVYIFKFSPLGSTVFPESSLVIRIMCEFVWSMSMESKTEWSSSLISVGSFLNGKKSHVHSFFSLPLAMCVLWFYCGTSSTKQRDGCVLSAEILFPTHLCILYSFWTLKEIRANRYHFVWHYFQLHAQLPRMDCPFPLLGWAIFSPQHHLML